MEANKLTLDRIRGFETGRLKKPVYEVSSMGQVIKIRKAVGINRNNKI